MDIIKDLAMITVAVFIAVLGALAVYAWIVGFNITLEIEPVASVL